jgi:uncharacterized membrane protein YfcA
MLDLETSLLLIVFGVFLVAGFVKGVIGLGLPTVAMGLLGTTMAPATAAALLVMPSFVTNLWQLLAGPSFSRLARRLWTLLAGIVVGTMAGAGLLTGATAAWAPMGLGIALVVYATLGLIAFRFRVAPRYEAWASPLVGVLTGLVTGATGVFVIPAVPYLQALELEKEDLIQALGLSFTISTVALAAGLAQHGAFQLAGAGLSLLAILPALLGMAVGQWLRNRISPPVFRRWFFVGLLLLGAHLALGRLL